MGCLGSGREERMDMGQGKMGGSVISYLLVLAVGIGRPFFFSEGDGEWRFEVCIC